MNESLDKKRILVGRFGAAQGVRGEIRIKSFTADPISLKIYTPLGDESGARIFAIEHLRLLRDDIVVAKIAGVDTREAAEQLTGHSLYVAREKLPPPDDEEFYISDLLGLAAVSPAGARLGVVRDIVNYGAGDILEITPIGGGASFLAPFTRACTPHIDFARGEITLIKPEEIE